MNKPMHGGELRSRILHIPYLLAFLSAVALIGCATDLKRAASPESIGLSSDRLKDVSAAFQTGVDRKEIAGAVVLIARRGRIGYFESFGYRDRETGALMSRDAIFRIASMTKPVTSVAAMMLVEQGRLSLSDPVSRYLPEFKNLKVGVEKKDASGSLVLEPETPHREMTVLDLMRHTSGLTYGFTGKSLVRDQYLRLGVHDSSQSNADFVAKISQALLQSQPGEVWDYGYSTDVLGRIIEVISGMELEQYFAERIFKPLGMVDTGFWVSDASQHSRIAEAEPDKTTGKRPPLSDKTKKSWQSGGGGLVSTAGDYARFCQMLLNGGELDRVRIISRDSVAQMTKNQLPQGIRINYFRSPVVDVRPEVGNGFGLGLMMRTADGQGPIPGNVGYYTWPGLLGTDFWVDPKKDLVVVIMIQVPASAAPIRAKYRTQSRELVYRILTD